MGFGILAAVALIFSLLFYIGLRKYLHSQSFSSFLEQKISHTTKAETSLQPLSWKGLAFESPNIAVQNEKLDLKVSQLTGEIGLGGVKKGYWEMSDVRLRSLDAKIKLLQEQSDVAVTTKDNSSNKSDAKGFFASFIPRRLEARNAIIDDVAMTLQTKDGDVQLRASTCDLKQEALGQKVYGVSVDRGELVHEKFPEYPLQLDNAKLRAQADRIDILQSSWTGFQDARIDVAGEILTKEKSMTLDGSVQQLSLKHIISEDWRKRVDGQLVTEFQYIKNKGDRGILSGRLEIQNATLTALPMLDRLATYTQQLDFRNIAFDEVSCDYKKHDKIITLTNILLSKKGLVKVSGELTINDRELDGLLNIGITPGTMSLIPVVEERIFTKQESGMVWVQVKIGGTLDHPTEDLKEKLFLVAGKRMLEMLPKNSEEAAQIVDTLSKVAAPEIEKLGDKIIEKSGDVLGGGDGVIKKGTGLLLDLLGGEEEEEEK